MQDGYNVVNTPFEMASKKRKKSSRKFRRRSRLNVMIDDDYSSDFSVTIIGEPDHTEIFEVEKIIMARYKLNAKKKKKKKSDNLDNFEFLIKWKNYDSDDNTWEPFENLSVNLKGEARKAALKLTEELKALKLGSSLNSNDQNMQSSINQIPTQLLNNIPYGMHINSNMPRLGQSFDSSLAPGTNSEALYNSNLYNRFNININRHQKNENTDNSMYYNNNIYNINNFSANENNDISQTNNCNTYDKKPRNLKSIISVSDKLKKKQFSNFGNTNNIRNSLDDSYCFRKKQASHNANNWNNNNEENDTTMRRYSLDDSYVYNIKKHTNKLRFFDDYKNNKTKDKNIPSHHRYLQHNYPNENENYNQTFFNVPDDIYSKNNDNWEIKETNKMIDPNSVSNNKRHKKSGNKIGINIMDNSIDIPKKNKYNKTVSSNSFVESSRDTSMCNSSSKKRTVTRRGSKNKQNNDINIRNNIPINHNDPNLSKCNNKNKLNHLNKSNTKNNNEKCKCSNCYGLMRMNKNMLNKYASEEKTDESLLKSMENIFNTFIELDNENQHCSNSTSVINSCTNSKLPTSESYRNNVRNVENVYMTNWYSKKTDNNNQTKNSYIYGNNKLNKENGNISKDTNEAPLGHLSTGTAHNTDPNNEHVGRYQNCQNVSDKRINNIPTYENVANELPYEMNRENSISKHSSGINNHYNANRILPNIPIAIKREKINNDNDIENSRKKNNDSATPLNLDNDAFENMSPESRFIRNISKLVDRNNDKCDYYIDVLENVLHVLKEKRINMQSYNTNNSTTNFMNANPKININKQTSHPTYNNHNVDNNYIQNNCYNYSNRNNINENNALNKNNTGFNFEQKQASNKSRRKKNNNLTEVYQQSQLYNNQPNCENFGNEQDSSKRKKNIRRTSHNNNCNTDSNTEYVNNHNLRNIKNNNNLNSGKNIENANDISMPNIINEKYNDKKRKIEMKNISTITPNIPQNNKEIIEGNEEISEHNWKNKKNVRKVRKKINSDKIINTNDLDNDKNINYQDHTVDKENSEQDGKNKYSVLNTLDINVIKENYMKKYSEYIESINKLTLNNIDALIKNINIINFYNRKTNDSINFIKGKFQVHLIESYTNILLYFDIFNDFKNYNFIYKNCEFLNTLLDHFWGNISENKNNNLDNSPNELSKNIILFSEIYKLNHKLNEFFKEKFLPLNLKPKLLYFPSPNYFMCFYFHLSSKTDYNNAYEDEEDGATTRASSRSKHTNSSKEHGESMNDISDNNKNNTHGDTYKDPTGIRHNISHIQINPYFLNGSNKNGHTDNITNNNDKCITRQNEEDNKSEYNSIITNDSFSAKGNDLITDNELDNTLDHAIISENCYSNTNEKANNEFKNRDHSNYMMDATHHSVACDKMKKTKYRDTPFQSKYDDSHLNKFEYQTDAYKEHKFEIHKGFLKHNLNNNKKYIFNNDSDANKNKLSLNENMKRDDCEIIEGNNGSLKADDLMQNSRIHENNSNENTPKSQIKFFINTGHGNDKYNIINNEQIGSEKSAIFKDTQNNLNDNILHLSGSGKKISYHDISFMSANEQSDQDENNNDCNGAENVISPFDETKMKLYDSVQKSNDFQSCQKEKENNLSMGKNESIYENTNTNNINNEYESVEKIYNNNGNFTDSNNMDKSSNDNPSSSNKNIRIKLNIQSLYNAYINLNDNPPNNSSYYDSYTPRSSSYNIYTDDKKNINNNILQEDIKNALYN
ncbi:conserved Plasmodium protein, unknown function [Plasmodium chabaudi adami]|uniref:Chromo domain-containing protein n=1 Tax=Plasmodium chabaudi adami TaxID=5826 RepID=A0A1D3LIL1_PLACE|nr:conserved Plasmodium protein, unknown function [Plasmodium chabaudi adami]